ncbi:MAG: hypothetical protein K6F75_02280 [Butyrivibrio sp.]|nr:hypothetical protein [Butyrivibrio sp.]
MKKYRKLAAACVTVAACVQLTACGLSDVPGLSEITGVDTETIDSEVIEKLEQGKEILSGSGEGISAFKETAEDINELADQATDFVSQMAEDIDAKGLVEELGKATGLGKDGKAGADSSDTSNSENSDSAATSGDGATTSGDGVTTSDDSASNDASTGGILKSAADINLASADGGTRNYTFTYNGETFKAKHTADHWTIYDSYKINSKSDMMIICQALIDLYPVHGSDMTSYRTAEDMTFEWQQHNLGYIFLGEKSEWASHLKDVDFDPADQGKTFDEIYKDRTGKEFKFSDFFSD